MGRDGLSVVEKVAIIIERFLDERATALGFNEILAGTPLSRATAHRLLTDMAAQGLLAQDSQRDEYRLGSLLLSAGALAQQAAGVTEVALPRMEALRDQFGETTLISELRDESVVPVRRVDGTHEMRMNQEIGRAYPAYAGASGQVLLAHLGPDALSDYLRGVKVEALTARTVQGAEELRRKLDRIRRSGVAVSVGQRVPDAIAISAPIVDGRGRTWALTVSGVASRWDGDRMFSAAQAVKEAAEAISRDLGFHPLAGDPTAAGLKEPGSDAHQALVRLCDEAWAGSIPEVVDG